MCKHFTRNERTCFTYYGSGTYWRRHLAKHGYLITTEILDRVDNREEFILLAAKWSEKLNVVESSEFANLVPERGDGGPTMLGRKMTVEQNKKKSKSLKAYRLQLSEERKSELISINSDCHKIRTYYTPAGEFHCAYSAGEANSCTNTSIINRCVKDVDKIITARRYPQWRNKTWRELGWSSTPSRPCPTEVDEV